MPNSDETRTNELACPVRFKLSDQSIEPPRATHRLEHDRFRAHVHDIRAVRSCNVEQLGPHRRLDGHFNQRQLALDCLVLTQLDHLEYPDQLLELLVHLIHRRGLAIDDDRHPADPRIAGRADRERGDVERPAREQTGDVREHAWLVLDQNREGVRGHFAITSLRAAACCSAGVNSGPRTMSSLGRPTGTMGKTPSASWVRKSTTAGTSLTDRAFSSTASTSPGCSQRSPTQP